MRRMGSIVLAAVIVSGCASQQVVTQAPPSPSSSPPSTQSPSVAPTKASAAPAVRPSVSPAPVTATTLTVKWKANDPTGIAALSTFVGVARSGDTSVLVGEMPEGDDGSTFAAWWSPDGRAWQLAQQFPMGERILALTAGGPGFVVAGIGDDDAAVWTSVDGRVWRPVSDASLSHGVIARLIPTASGVVGFGWHSDDSAPAIWTSADGIAWLAATNESGLMVARGLKAVGAYDGRAIAFVDEGTKAGLSVWETSGRAEWTRTGTLPKVKTMERVAGGARGWVALNSHMAWTSRDGRTWSKAVSGPDVASDVIVDDAGYVAVGWIGSLPGETCGDQRPFAGHTWTSADGRVWKLMPRTKEFSSAMVMHLMIEDRTLIGYGQRFDATSGETMPIARWTDALPDLAKPAATSDKPSVPKTCGG